MLPDSLLIPIFARLHPRFNFLVIRNVSRHFRTLIDSALEEILEQSILWTMLYFQEPGMQYTESWGFEFLHCYDHMVVFQRDINIENVVDEISVHPITYQKRRDECAMRVKIGPSKQVSCELKFYNDGKCKAVIIEFHEDEEEGKVITLQVQVPVTDFVKLNLSHGEIRNGEWNKIEDSAA
jgi:hypothetical protein